MMVLKLFLCFLTVFGSLVTFSGSQDVCACCGEQVLRQNMTDCSDVATPASEDDLEFLKNFCLTWGIYHAGQDYNVFKLLILSEFQTSSMNYLKLPIANIDSCHTVLSSLEGLLYTLPLNQSSEYFNDLRRTTCFPGFDVLPEGDRLFKVPGAACFFERSNEFDEIYTFKQFNLTKMYSRTNVTTKIFFVRRPVSYVISSVDKIAPPMQIDKDFDRRYESYLPKKQSFGEFTVCNPTENLTPINIHLPVPERIFLDFHNFTFYPQLVKKMGTHSYYRTPATILTINDNAERKTIILNPYDNIFRYTKNATAISILIDPDLRNAIPPFYCLTAEIEGTWSTWKTTITSKIELDFGPIGNHTRKQFFLNGTKTSETCDLKLVNINLEQHQGIVILSLYEIYFYSGIVAGMVFFLILLCITVKCMGCVERTDFRKDWNTASEGMQTAGEFIKLRAAILGNQLIRVGDYICNVGTWVYQEIKEK
ncbi:hypothetical protein DMENIID0001_167880 [Sergentomyia squamirostris]